MFSLNLKFSWLSYFEKIEGMGRTDGQIDGQLGTGYNYNT